MTPIKLATRTASIRGSNDGLADVHRIAAIQHHLTERDFRRKVGAGKRGLGCDDEIEGVRFAWRKFGFVLGNDPLGRLPHHGAMLIEQETDGAGGFNFFRQPVAHGQFDKRFLADDLWRRDGDGELG